MVSPRHLALVGPTASGKSAVAVEVALALGDVEVVTVDSMQVYRGMNVGTATPSREEQRGVTHHLLGVADPAERFDVVRFQAAAKAAVADIEERGRRALLVGGTGLYLAAVVDDLEIPGQYPEVRDGLEDEPDTNLLHRRLTELDPVAAGRMEPGNRRRVVRALEVTLGSGRPFSSFGPGVTAHHGSNFRLAGLWLPRTTLARRIADRVDMMLTGGLVGEVEALLAAPSGWERTARQALGYREIAEAIEGGSGVDGSVREAVVSRTRAFARRQRVWFRRDHRITWYGSVSDPGAVVPALLGDWKR